jgi:hypothetical protein
VKQSHIHITINILTLITDTQEKLVDTKYFGYETHIIPKTNNGYHPCYYGNCYYRGVFSTIGGRSGSGIAIYNNFNIIVQSPPDIYKFIVTYYQTYVESPPETTRVYNTDNYQITNATFRVLANNATISTDMKRYEEGTSLLINYSLTTQHKILLSGPFTVQLWRDSYAFTSSTLQLEENAIPTSTLNGTIAAGYNAGIYQLRVAFVSYTWAISEPFEIYKV